jgi:hypothetical protein
MKFFSSFAFALGWANVEVLVRVLGLPWCRQLTRDAAGSPFHVQHPNSLIRDAVRDVVD